MTKHHKLYTGFTGSLGLRVEHSFWQCINIDKHVQTHKSTKLYLYSPYVYSQITICLIRLNKVGHPLSLIFSKSKAYKYHTERYEEHVTQILEQNNKKKYTNSQHQPCFGGGVKIACCLGLVTSAGLFNLVAQEEQGEGSLFLRLVTLRAPT